MNGLRLHPAADRDFAWLLDPQTPHPAHLTLPPGMFETPAILRRLRAVANNVRAQHPPGMWLMIAGEEIVGLIGYKLAPDSEGRIEIAYGIAESRRRRGLGTEAVRALARAATEDAHIRLLYAETAVANLPSQKILRANGFRQRATRQDADDGALLCWSRRV